MMVHDLEKMFWHDHSETAALALMLTDITTHLTSKR